MSKRRPLALGAAAAIGLGSLFVAAPAIAEETEAPTANLGTTAQAFADAAVIENTTGIDDIALGAAVTTAGESVVFVDQAKANDPAHEEALSEAVLQIGSKVVLIPAVTPDAADDVVGGAGYGGEVSPGRIGFCSIGFSAYDSATGDPAVITAGHCTEELGDVYLTVPADDTAGGGTGNPTPAENLGTWAFAQFGGLGNSVGEDGDLASVDIGVIDVTNDDLTVQPAVTDWSDTNDLFNGSIQITGSGLPQSGTVEKSGRTTGYTQGPTELRMPVQYSDGSTGIEPIEVLDGWIRIGGKYVHGFLGGALTESGDSGGAVFQGNTAVGVVSGGPEEGKIPEGADDWAWYALLEPSLEQVDGDYEVAVAVQAPTTEGLPTSGIIAQGGSFTVQATGNATGLILDDGEGDPTVVNGTSATIDADEAGEFSLTAIATNGHSQSAPLEIEYEVRPAGLTLDDNSIRTTENGVTVSGTAEPFATITLTGDLADTVEADENGDWSVEFTGLAIGRYSIEVTQTVDGVQSAATEGTIEIAPESIEIESIEPGQTFEHDAGPEEISGTGALPGAEITGTLNGADLAATTADENGDWTLDLESAAGSGAGAETAAYGAVAQALATGDYTVLVAQTVNDVTSDEAGVTFEVAAAPSDADADNAGAGAGAGAGGTAEGTASAGAAAVGAADSSGAGSAADGSATGGSGSADGSGELPETGLDLTPYMIAVALMLMLGVGAMVVTQRRLQRTEVSEG